MRAPAAGLLALALALVPSAAAAQSLVLSLSAPTVIIRSNFTGATVVLFGIIESEGGAPAARGGYDLVVTVASPPHNLVARRKAKIGGMWLNAESRTFIGVPDFFALLANRPLATIADPAQLQRLGLTPETRLKPGAAAAAEPELAAFQSELLRLKTSERLWVIQPNGVDFITPSLFRATIPLPAHVPTGLFKVRATLFRGGRVVAQADDSLVVTKSGFEDQVAQWAENDALLYGIGSALLAVLFGFLASVAFRR